MAAMARRLLRVNLSTGKSEVEEIPQRVVENCIGGRGFGADYMYREMSPGTDPLGADNKLILLTGPLAGTQAQAVSRWGVTTRSPLSNAIVKSCGGADFGAWLRFSGYDMIIVEGKAEKPVYIHLSADGCRTNDAGEMWGKDIDQTQSWLRRKHGKDMRAACIGPAAEKLVKFAHIASERRTASRCGAGTVMGSKNLKAVAISAKRTLTLHDPEGFKLLVKEQVEHFKKSKAWEYHREMGTTSTQNVTNALGIFPVRNYTRGRMPDPELIGSDVSSKWRTTDFGCYSCGLRCGKTHEVKSGRYAGAWSHGPEYETFWAFTGTIESTKIEAAIMADQLCDLLGMDTISCGATIGFAFDLYENGILTKSDTDGLELTWGNHEAMVELVKKIAAREGIGDILAEGSKGAAEKIGKGAEYYAMHCKGVELPAYDPRGAKSQGYSYATSNVGGIHGYGYASQEIFGAPFPRPVDRFAETENADIVVHNQNSGALTETGINCVFATSWAPFPMLYGKMLVAATGIEKFSDPGYLMRVGERIVNLERAFNMREGFSRKDDYLPERLRTEPLIAPDRASDGQLVRESDAFLDKYYELRGWDSNGVPTPEKLKALDIDPI